MQIKDGLLVTTVEDAPNIGAIDRTANIVSNQINIGVFKAIQKLQAQIPSSGKGAKDLRSALALLRKADKLLGSAVKKMGKQVDDLGAAEGNFDEAGGGMF